MNEKEDWNHGKNVPKIIKIGEKALHDFRVIDRNLKAHGI